MKSQNRFLNALFALTFVIAGTASSAALAGNEGHGGYAVVCFKTKTLGPIDIQGMIDKNGYITPLGIQSISSAEALDYARVEEQLALSPRLKFLKKMDYIEISLQAHESIALDGQIEGYYRQARELIGFIGDSTLPLSHTKMSSQDHGAGEYESSLPDNCGLAQVVRRTREIMEVEWAIWEKMDEIQKAFLQIHEEVYYIATDIIGRDLRDSTAVQNLTQASVLGTVTPTLVHLAFWAGGRP